LPRTVASIYNSAVKSRESTSNPNRLASLDAYRGFVMLLMAGEVLRFGAVADGLTDGTFWKALWDFLANQQSHVEWRGCVLHDLIQPSFSFLVGVALPWSVASRRNRGDSFGVMLGHTVWRSIVLILLGVVLRSTHSRQTNWTFEDTLSQIGLGYTFLWLLAWTKLRTQWIALGGILIGYWALFAFWPLPPAGFDMKSVGVNPDYPHLATGFAAHWNKNMHPAQYFDAWFLNLFSREQPWTYNGGGYVTLSFIPTLGTMLLGLLAGQWLRRDDVAGGAKVKRLALCGAAGLVVATVLDLTGICPSVKKIWTPAWVLFSGGWCSLLLAGFYWLVDVKLWRSWAFPLVVVGMNSIFMYCVAHLWDGFIMRLFKTHFGQELWKNLGGPVAPFLEGVAVLSVLWLCCWWLWRKKVFIRV
jgi:predicted acyltransferase